MTEAAILAAVEGTNKRLDDLNANVSAYRKEGQTANTALWNEVNEGKKCMTEMKLKTKGLEGKIKGLGKDIQTLASAMSTHIKSKTEHFNKAIADEGAMAYAWRNKLKIAIITTLTTLITVGGGLLITWLQSIPIGG